MPANESIQAMSPKMTLDVAAMQQEFFSNTALIGIVSALPAYRFCWLINERFDMAFERDADSDILLQDQHKRACYFPVYRYCAPLNGMRSLIYKLKHEKESLLPEVKQIDYLWMIESNDPEGDAASLTQYLRSIPDVQLAQVIVPERLKHLNHLIV